MEAVGAVASIVGLAGAGAKISLALFDVAKKIGSAGEEMRFTGTEISLFCAVLKQLERTLHKLSRKRYSISAIEVTQQVLEHCDVIFKALDSQLADLQGLVDWKARLKWVAGTKSRFQMQRATLESCKLTLQIMLTTLNFAETVSSRRGSTVGFSMEDEEEELVATCLVAAQQDAIERLQEMERTRDEEAATAAELPPETPPPKYTRDSIWLQSLGVGQVSDGPQRSSVSSSSSAMSQLSGLLSKWTDQGPHWHEIHTHSNRNSSAVSPTQIITDAPPFKAVEWLKDESRAIARAPERRSSEPPSRLRLALHSKSAKEAAPPRDLVQGSNRVNGSTLRQGFQELDFSAGAELDDADPVDITPKSQSELPNRKFTEGSTPRRLSRKRVPAALDLQGSKSPGILGPLTSPSPVVASIRAKERRLAALAETSDKRELGRPVNEAKPAGDDSAPQPVFARARHDIGPPPGTPQRPSAFLRLRADEVVELNTQVSPFCHLSRDGGGGVEFWLDARLDGLDGARGYVPALALVPVFRTTAEPAEARTTHIFADAALQHQFMARQAWWASRRQAWWPLHTGGYSTEDGSYSAALPPWPAPASRGMAEAPVWRSLAMRVRQADGVDAVVAATLAQLGLPGRAHDYALYVACEGRHVLVGPAERPGKIFKRLQQEGKTPSFVVQEKSGTPL